MKRLTRSLLVLTLVGGCVHAQDSDSHQDHEGNWVSWRGPLQTGVSLEHYSDYEFAEKPAWTDDIAGRGTPVVYDGRLYTWGYRGEGPNLEEVLQARKEKSGGIVWERATHDFISDTIYNRYTIGAPAVDPETENVIVASTYGLITCYDKEGNEVWQHSLMERFGRLSFPNGRAGAPVIDGDIVIARGVCSYWGAQGPARDRFFGFDKNTGELLWISTPGVGAPFLRDSSFSQPWVETRDGKRVFYAGTGCGNIVCVNLMDGTPLWRFQVSKGGVNSAPVIHGDTLIGIHGVENLDSTEMGRLFAIELPEDYDNPGGEVDPEQGGAPRLPQEAEIWRAPLEMFTSSPVLHDGKVYQMVTTGELVCVDAESGETLWKEKLANSQLHASPALADGRLYVPSYPGKFYVIDVTGEKPAIEHELKLEGNCIGSPAICNGRVYVHTTEKFYAFEIGHSDIEWADAPEESMPEKGEPAKLMPVPGDVLLRAGQSEDITLRKLDENGFPVGKVEGDGEWETFVPPSAKVQARMDAEFEGNTISAAADADLSAGAWKVKADGLEGLLRGRVIADLPYRENFEEGFAFGENDFAHPPLPWIGARLKWEVRERDGNKVLRKTLDRVLFQRALSFIGDPDLSDYTMTADVMTEGSRRIKSVVGLINQHYLIYLDGNKRLLEVSSNHERIKESVSFNPSAGQWYTLKTRVDVAEDGSGVVRAKVWEKGGSEPGEWTIEVEHADAHDEGAPGLFGFAPQSQEPVFIDNVVIESNE